MTCRACSFEGDVDVAPDTWRDRLLRKLGPEFKIKKGDGREMLTKRCEIRFWDEQQLGDVEVAFVFDVLLVDLPNNINPALIAHSTIDKVRLKSLLSNRWKVETKMPSWTKTK
jgi:hypothetical protein